MEIPVKDFIQQADNQRFKIAGIDRAQTPTSHLQDTTAYYKWYIINQLIKTTFDFNIKHTQT